MAEVIVLQNVRCCYVHVDVPYKFPDDPEDKKPEYSMRILLPKDHAQVSEIEEANERLVEETFSKLTKAQKAKLRHPLKDGDELEDDLYHGHWFLNSHSVNKPKVLNRRKEKPSEEDYEDYCYSGARFHVSITLATFDKANNRGVGCYLRNVMFYKRDEPLVGSTAEADFEEVEVEDDDDDESLVD